ncbi:MAG: PilN domain-containing protein [Candidatus Omnitrophota bacterium]|jgi:Tfp pilus assembly protein PilN
MMITINLLPDELKGKPKSEGAGFKFVLKEAYFVYLLPVLLCTLVCLHILLGLFAVAKGVEITSLSNKWAGLAGQRKELDAFMQMHAAFSEDALILQQLASQRINWAQKLNKLSLNLPAGVWFNELSVNQKDFVLKGSVISLQKEDMGLIHKFLTSLQSDPDFSGDFYNLELSSIQNRSVGGYEVSDFMLTGALKKR